MSPYAKTYDWQELEFAITERQHKVCEWSDFFLTIKPAEVALLSFVKPRTRSLVAAACSIHFED